MKISGKKIGNKKNVHILILRRTGNDLMDTHFSFILTPTVNSDMCTVCPRMELIREEKSLLLNLQQEVILYEKDLSRRSDYNPQRSRSDVQGVNKLKIIEIFQERTIFCYCPQQKNYYVQKNSI